VCDIECPLKELAKKCGLKRLTEQSDQEYIDACNAVIIKVRQENRAALRAAEARGLRSSFPEEDDDVEEEETAVVTDVEVEDVSTDDISGLGWWINTHKISHTMTQLKLYVVEKEPNTMI